MLTIPLPVFEVALDEFAHYHAANLHECRQHLDDLLVVFIQVHALVVGLHQLKDQLALQFGLCVAVKHEKQHQLLEVEVGRISVVAEEELQVETAPEHGGVAVVRQVSRRELLEHQHARDRKP